MIGPFDVRKKGQSKWIAGLVHAELQVRLGNRSMLEDNVECSRSFGDYDDFDLGIENYLDHFDHRLEDKA
jgi:hypothetical protein